jgi:hypothetical protein
MAWRYNLAITNSQVNARPVVYILNRKPLGYKIYKLWELESVMVISLDTEIWVIGKGGTQKGE